MADCYVLIEGEKPMFFAQPVSMVMREQSRGKMYGRAQDKRAHPLTFQSTQARQTARPIELKRRAKWRAFSY